MATSPSLRVVVFGATGVAGSGVLHECLADARIREVRAVVRRPLGIASPKLREISCADFGDLSPIAADLADLDACFYCLGVSQTQVGDPAKYREITYDYALAAARVLLERSPRCLFHFLSGQGTNAKGTFLWARVKGETENALMGLGLGGAVCWRPGYIHATEAAAHRQLAERAARVIYPLFKGFRGLSVTAVDFGRAMLQATFEERRAGVIENSEIRAIAGRYAPSS